MHIQSWMEHINLMPDGFTDPPGIVLTHTHSLSSRSSMHTRNCSTFTKMMVDNLHVFRHPHTRTRPTQKLKEASAHSTCITTPRTRTHTQHSTTHTVRRTRVHPPSSCTYTPLLLSSHLPLPSPLSALPHSRLLYITLTFYQMFVY